MKAIQGFVLLYLCLLLAAPVASAQGNESNRVSAPCRSTWWEYGSIPSHYSIIRDDNTYRIIHSEHHDNTIGINVHTFAIHSYATNQDFKFSTQFDAADSTDHNVSISDMELFNGWCYFCGTLVYDYVDFSGRPATDGLVGRFSVSSLFGSTATMEYCLVKDAGSLRAMTVSVPEGRMSVVMLHAVGDMKDNNNYASCIVELEHTLPGGWTATLGHLPQPPKIYFSDIERVATGVVLAAQTTCANPFPYGYPDYDTNHQQFMLDMFSMNGCYHDHQATSTDNMALYVMDCADDYCFHENKAPMKLSRTPSNMFYLAFGVRENVITPSGLRLFSFQNDPYNNVESVYYNMGGDQNMLDMVCPSANRPILLSQGYPYRKGIITLPGVTDPSFLTARAFYDDERHLQSLSLSPTENFIDVSGRELSVPDLMRYSQEYTVWSETSCFQKTTFDEVGFRGLDFRKFPVEWEFPYYKDPVTWKISNVTLVEVKETNKCKQCE